MTTPIIKPRVPLYLRQNGPRHRKRIMPINARFSEAEKLIRDKYNAFEAGWRQGSLCRCLSCGWMAREKQLKIVFFPKSMRGVETCPTCHLPSIQFFDNLTPAQEALLEP